MMSNPTYREVIDANIAVHSKMAASYPETEPHFRPENVRIVDGHVARLVAETKARSLLDLGCGTGFMIGIAKKHVKRIVGVDVTKAMLERVDKSGDATIELHEHDTGTFEPEPGSFDLVTAYSFLHHLYDIVPTLRTAAKALRPGGKLYADLDPNHYFWDAIAKLDPNGTYDPIVTREIGATVQKPEEVNREWNIPSDVFDRAEYGKNIAGGFREDVVRKQLTEVGFSSVTFSYYWFLGQASIVNDPAHSKDENVAAANRMDAVLQKAMPLSRALYKYVGFVATR
jgi:SAM-dependent methyltransferase